MKILIDLQSCQSASKYRGIGRYSIELAEAMIKNGMPKHEFFILLNLSLSEAILKIRKRFEPLIGINNIITFGCPNNISVLNQDKDKSTIAQEIREFAINEVNPDFVHISSYFEGYSDNAVVNISRKVKYQTAVTLYDCIPLINEDTYLKTPFMEEWYRGKINDLKQSDVIFSISKSAKSEGVNYACLDEKLIVNISSAVSSDICEKVSDKESVFDKFSIDKEFILYTGNLDPRKNLKNLFMAYNELPRELRIKNKLVIVLKYDDSTYISLQRMAKSAGLNDYEYTFTGYISDEDLNLLYRECSVFVFPSLHEGFGLPCLEAMAFEAPVIGSNTTSIPEVIAWKEALFDPHSPKEIANTICRALTEPEFRSKLIENSKVRVKEFSWQKSALLAINTMEKKYLKKQLTSSELSNNYAAFIDSLKSLSFKTTFSDGALIEIANCIDVSMPKHKHELLIDITALAEHDSKTGIQRVVKSIIEQWCELKLSHQIRLVYLASDGHYCYACDYESKNTQLQGESKGYVLPSSGDVFVGLDLVAHAAACTGGIYKKWRESGVLICIVVYDILPITMPSFFHSGIRDAFPVWGRMIIEKADLLLCISESVANDLKEFIASSTVERILPYAIEYFHLGADFNLSEKPIKEIDEELLSGIDLSKTFIMVGTIEPRKGHQQVVDAFEALSESYKDYTLLIVGRVGWNTERLIKKLESANSLASNIRWLSDCSDDTLQYLYRNSVALIAASYGEGFGLPLIEAAQFEIPIIARDIPVFREVAGQHAYYFEDNVELDSIVRAIELWLHLYEQDCHPKSSGMPWMTWEKSAAQLMSKLTSYNSGGSPWLRIENPVQVL